MKRPGQGPTATLEILLVEDDQAHAELIIRCLENHPLDSRIRHLSDGEAALDYLLSEAEGGPGRPHVILLDLRLPKIDGLEVLRQIRAAGSLDGMIADRVVMGHNIGFDLAVLGAECRRAGLDWSAPPTLDLVQLGAALEPRNGDLTLEGMAARYGVAVAGRHTALGDALAAAELWLCLVPRLAEHGVETFGDATAFAARAREVIRKQRQSGW